MRHGWPVACMQEEKGENL